jgi:hypothetical protein
VGIPVRGSKELWAYELIGWVLTKCSYGYGSGYVLSHSENALGGGSHGDAEKAKVIGVIAGEAKGLKPEFRWQNDGKWIWKIPTLEDDDTHRSLSLVLRTITMRLILAQIHV